MATKQITFKGKAEWCKPYAFQLDTDFVDNTKGPDPRGGNYSTGIVLDDEGVALFKSLGAKAKLKAKKDTDGPVNIATLRRYERHPVLGELGLVVVTGVEDGTLIGNGSDITCVVDLYDFSYNGRPSRGIRWVSVNVDTLVTYVKPDTDSKPAVGVPVI